MSQKPREKIKKEYLPDHYMNPWTLSNLSFAAMFADLRLRIRAMSRTSLDRLYNPQLFQIERLK